jgi:predicted HTH domain antitoxin
MSYQTLTAALTLYRSGTLSLEQAANHSGVPTAKVASELRSRGISVRETDRDTFDGRQIN